MPATMEIRENGHVVYFVFSSPFTTQDMIDAMHKDGEYRNSVPFKVHALARIAFTEMPPLVMRARQSPSIVHANSGYFAIVGANDLMRVLAGAITRMTRNNNIKFFDTENDAWAFLRDAIAKENDSSTS